MAGTRKAPARKAAAPQSLDIDYKFDRDTKTTLVYVEENPTNPERPMRFYIDKPVIDELDNPEAITLTVTPR